MCANCGTTQTPMWRKASGIVMCNACAVYYKTNGRHRWGPDLPEHPTAGQLPWPPAAGAMRRAGDAQIIGRARRAAASCAAAQ